MLKVTNLDQVFKDLDNWASSVEVESVAIVKGYAVRAYTYLLMRSPQFSGDFVANWNVSVGSQDFSFTPFTSKRADPLNRGRSFDMDSANYKRGDRPAVREAISRNRGKLDGFSLGQTIYFSNDSFHVQGNKGRLEHYAGLIENNQIALRPENERGFEGGGSGHNTVYTKAFMQGRYPIIGREDAAKWARKAA